MPGVLLAPPESNQSGYGSCPTTAAQFEPSIVGLNLCSWIGEQRDLGGRCKLYPGMLVERHLSLPDHSALILAARITFADFSVASAMSWAKSAGEPASTVPPRSATRAFIFGSASATLISLLSFSTISAGVFLGAPMPCQTTAS